MSDSKTAAYVVASGRAITATGSRVLEAGSPVTPADLGGGEEAFKVLLAKNLIEKAKAVTVEAAPEDDPEDDPEKPPVPAEPQKAPAKPASKK